MKVAFDIGGVIVDKTSRTPYQGALMSIRMFTDKLKPENVYILSKAKDKWIKANLELFDSIDFYNRTNILKANIIFVDEYVDKQVQCNHLGIQYMIDDSIKVIRFMQDIETKAIWFGKHNKPQEDLDYIDAPTWKSIRKFLARN